MNILGINYYQNDSSACLIKNGELVAAAEEERFVRIKHFSGFPKNSMEFCLDYGKIKISEVDYVALNYNPNSNFKEKITYSLKNIFKISTIKKIYNQKISLRTKIFK